MLRYTFNLAFMRASRAIYRLLYYALIGTLFFLAFSLPISKEMISNSYRYAALRTTSSLFYVIIAFLVIFEGVNRLINEKKDTKLEKIRAIATLPSKRFFLYYGSDVVIAIIGSVIGLVFGILTIFLIEYTVFYPETVNITLFFWPVIVALLVPLVLSLIFSLIIYFRGMLDRLLNAAKEFPYFLGIIEIFLFIFLSKNNTITIFFVIIAAILLVYIIQGLYRYVSNRRAMKSSAQNYVSLLSSSFVYKRSILFYVVSITIALMSISFLTMNISDYQSEKNYIDYDYAVISGGNGEEAIRKIADYSDVHYLPVSDEISAKYGDIHFIIYISDLTVAPDFVSPSFSSPGSNEDNQIILPSCFKDKVSTNSKINIFINDRKYELTVVGFNDDMANLIAFASNISGLTFNPYYRILLKATTSSFDFISLSNDLQMEVVSKNDIKLNYNRAVVYRFAVNIIIFVLIIASLFVIYFLLTKSEEELEANMVNKLRALPVRDQTISRLIYQNKLGSLSLTILSFIVLGALAFSAFSSSIHESEIKPLSNLGVASSFLYLLEIYVVYNLIFIFEFLLRRLPGVKENL